MSDQSKSQLIRYGCSALFTIALVSLNLWLTDGWDDMGTAQRYRVLCDAFTIPGIMELMIGCLLALSNAGAFLGIGYALSTGLSKLIPGKGLTMPEKYYDYVQRKREKRVTGFGFIWVTGAITLAIAIVFLFLYYQVK